MPLREDILNPIPGDNPSGENLRYAPIYDQIKEARREDDDVPQGEWQIEIKKADWVLVIKLASEALATKSKDLQIAAWLTEAMLRREGFAGLQAGLVLLAWPDCEFLGYAVPGTRRRRRRTASGSTRLGWFAAGQTDQKRAAHARGPGLVQVQGIAHGSLRRGRGGERGAPAGAGHGDPGRQAHARGVRRGLQRHARRLLRDLGRPARGLSGGGGRAEGRRRGEVHRRRSQLRRPGEGSRGGQEHSSYPSVEEGRRQAGGGSAERAGRSSGARGRAGLRDCRCRGSGAEENGRAGAGRPGRRLRAGGRPGALPARAGRRKSGALPHAARPSLGRVASGGRRLRSRFLAARSSADRHPAGVEAPGRRGRMAAGARDCRNSDGRAVRPRLARFAALRRDGLRQPRILRRDLGDQERGARAAPAICRTWPTCPSATIRPLPTEKRGPG